MKKLSLFTMVLVMMEGAVSASNVSVQKSPDGWRLLVEGQPYFVKGIPYLPTKIGEDPNVGTQRDWMIVDDNRDGKIDAPFQSWVDDNFNNIKDNDEVVVGDFELLKKMGCNTIRLYHHASANPLVQALHKQGTGAFTLYNHAPNKELLRELFQTTGIRVAMGDALGAYVVGSGADWVSGTDYSDPIQRQRMLLSVEDMINEFKNEPFILMWVLGNENNYEEFTHTNAAKNPVAYAQFVNEVATRIHQLDPNHPVCLCNGDTQFSPIYAQYAPQVDIFGLNSYRFPTFGSLWNDVKNTFDRPVLLTEFGHIYPRVNNHVLDENQQSDIHRSCWMDIENHKAGAQGPGNAIGGFAFEWIDEWWMDGSPSTHDTNPIGNGIHHEYMGLVSQGDGHSSPLMRQLRQVYFTYQSLWTRPDIVKPETILTMDHVTIFPNPYRLGSGVPLTLTNIPDKASIQILTVDGQLVRELTSENNSATWDGSNGHQQTVASGVYYVLIQSATDRLVKKLGVQP